MSPTFESNETIDLTALKIIIDNWDDLPLTEDQKKPIKIQDKEYSQLTLLKKFLKQAGTTGVVQTTYFYSQNHSPSCPGRQFVKGGMSLQGSKRWIRHTIAPGYHDYDMVNCHPEAFIQYCKKKNWDTSPFQSYSEKREEHLKEIVEKNDIIREIAKSIVLSILNGGNQSYNALPVQPMWLQIYALAVEQIHKKIMNEPENAELVKSVKAYKKRNIGGSVMNHILCDIENQCLKYAIEFLGVKDPVLCFDGFMSKAKYSQEKLDEMADYIYEKTGYRFKWIEKPMDEGIDLTGFSVKENEEKKEKVSDLALYNLVMDKYGRFIKRDEGVLLIYDERTGMWSSGDDAVGIWFNMCENIGYGDYHNQMRNSFALTKKIPNTTGYFDKAKMNRRDCLLFNNGILNLLTGELKPFSPDYFFKIRIDRNYNPVRDEMKIAEVKRRYFDDPHPDEEVRNELWKITSIAMTGRNLERGFTNNIGQTRCGKSTIMNVMMSAFYPFVKSISSQAFTVSKFASANPHNDQLLLLEDSRLIFASEKPGAGEIDYELVKSITGGDAITVRGCGKKAERAFFPEAHLMFQGNSPLVFNNKDSALQDRNKSIKWTVQFPINSEFDDWGKSDEAKDALVHLILDGIKLHKTEGFIKVKGISDFTQQINEEEDKFLGVVEEHFTLSVETEKQETWILANDVYKLFKLTQLSQYQIKERFQEHGIVCARSRKGTEINPRSYFKGLVRKSREMSDDY